MPVPHVRVPGLDDLLQLLTLTSHYCRLWEEAVMTQEIGFLICAWKTCSGFPAPWFAISQADYCGYLWSEPADQSSPSLPHLSV